MESSFPQAASPPESNQRSPEQAGRRPRRRAPPAPGSQKEIGRTAGISKPREQLAGRLLAGAKCRGPTKDSRRLRSRSITGIRPPQATTRGCAAWLQSENRDEVTQRLPRVDTVSGFPFAADRQLVSSPPGLKPARRHSSTGPSPTPRADHESRGLGSAAPRTAN